MDRKTMISEIVGAKEEMFQDDPKGNPFTAKNVARYNTARLEKLHTKTMDEHRAWMSNQEEREESKKLAEAIDQDTALAVKAGLITNPADKPEYPGCDPDKRCVHGHAWGDVGCPYCDGHNGERDVKDEHRDQSAAEQGETEMTEKKKEGKGKGEKKAGAAPKEKPFKVTDRVVFEALSKTVWTEEDRPDLGAMTEAEISEELKESLQLLAPEDQGTIEAMNHGAEIWSALCGMRKDLAEKAVAAPKKTKEPAKKKTKEPAENGGQKEKDRYGFRLDSIKHQIALAVEAVGENGITVKEIKALPWNVRKDSYKAYWMEMVDNGFASFDGSKVTIK